MQHDWLFPTTRGHMTITADASNISIGACLNQTIFPNHKPIVGAFKSDKQRLSDKQQRQLSFISETTLDIIHVAD